MTQDLIKSATDVREMAHAPYSKFKVGAAIRAANGDVFSGCNVENVAYPEGTCAEAGAIAAMCAAGQYEIAEVVVIAGSEHPTPPCGGCRQKLSEFAKGDVKVTMVTTGGASKETTVGDLLPGSFSQDHLTSGSA